jgi:hypothetical protein
MSSSTRVSTRKVLKALEKLHAAAKRRRDALHAPQWYRDALAEEDRLSRVLVRSADRTD